MATQRDTSFVKYSAGCGPIPSVEQKKCEMKKYKVNEKKKTIITPV